MKARGFLIIVGISLAIGGPAFGARYGPDEPGEVGDLLHRTSGDGLMWGLDGYTEGITDIFSIHPGHAGIFVGISSDPDRGFEDAAPQVVEAIGRPPNSGVVEINDLADFCSHSTMVFLGAQTADGLTAEQRANIVILACDQIGEGYNEDMSSDHQKGPGDDQWICSGLAEKIYESCNKNFGMDLSYYHQYPYQDEDGTVHVYPGYAGWGGVDVTPDGRIDTPDNEVSETVEQTKVNWLMFYRYIFFPYTQMIQPALIDSQAITPTSWAALSPPQPDGDNGWYTMNVEVTLDASDGDCGSGIYYIRYCVGSGGSWTLYESPYQVTETNHIYSYAKDNAGNYPGSVYPDAYVKIDKTPPEFGSGANTVNPAPGSYDIYQEISDADSGVRDDSSYPRIYYRWNNSVIDEAWYDGYASASYDPASGCYQASVAVGLSHIGDKIYWRCLAIDQAGHESWTVVRDGGVIGSGSGYDRIVDNDDAGFYLSSFDGQTDYWYYEPDRDYWWTYANDKNDHYADWKPDFGIGGDYEIYACFYGRDSYWRSDNVRYVVLEKGTEEHWVTVAQTGGEYEWKEVCLGTFSADPGASTYVRVIDNDEAPYDGHRLILADMVKFIYQEPLPTPEPTPELTPEPTPQPTPEPTPQATPAPTVIPAPSATPNVSPSPSVTPSVTPKPSATPSASPNPSLTPTPPYLELTVFRPSTGLWAVRKVTRVYFGRAGDLPVAGDYSGDGSIEIAVFRPSSGLWAIRQVTRVYFGREGDLPVPGDYSGGASMEIAVFRPDTGLWAIRNFTRIYFGREGDTPVPGYYVGDGIAEPAIFRPESGLWAVRSITRAYFGAAGDLPVPKDYSGSGTWDMAIFRPASGLWAIRGFSRIYFGRSGDRPVPADYRRIGADEIGVFRPGSGLWAIRGLTRAYFGGAGDVPVTQYIDSAPDFSD